MTGPMIERLGRLISWHLASSRATRSFQQGKEGDARRFLDFAQQPIEPLLAAHRDVSKRRSSEPALFQQDS